MTSSAESREVGPDLVFRPEAVAHHERAAAPGPSEPLRIESWRLTAAYRGVIALLALAFAAVCVVQIDARVRGPFRAQPTSAGSAAWSITAAFPARYAGALAPGTRLELLDDAGCLDAATAIARLDPPAVTPGAARTSDPVVTAHAVVADSPCGGPERSGVADATIDSAPLLSYFFPRLRAPLARLREAL